MSQYNSSSFDRDQLSSLFADACDRNLEAGLTDSIADADLSRALVSAIRLFAAKAQAGETPELVQGNHSLSATDGAIAATAILEAVGIEVFELATWQACSNVGSRRNHIKSAGPER
jgi:hypothetical protein